MRKLMLTITATDEIDLGDAAKIFDVIRQTKGIVSAIVEEIADEPSLLISLETHETSRRQEYASIFYPAIPRKNGIACPTCGAELVDTDPMSLLTVLPPRKKVSCTTCGYTGSRIA